MSEEDWDTVGGLRKSVRMIRPIIDPPFSDTLPLWDGSKPQTRYPLMSEDPNPDHAEPRWADGTPSGFIIDGVSAPGPTMTVQIRPPAAFR